MTYYGTRCIMPTTEKVKSRQTDLSRGKLQLGRKMADLDRWVELVKDCKYLPENDLKQLCDIVCDILLEESNIQPVSTPVTVCGDIHGQVRVDGDYHFCVQLKVEVW